MKIVKIDESIFREYDIRGIYEKDIDEDVSYTMGRSFGSYIKTKEVIIGHDNRESSPVIKNALIKGIMESGCKVIDLGLVTTPMYYFAKKKNKIQNGIMITASHNPKEYNGFKISFDLIGNSCGQEIRDFRDYTNNGIFETGNGSLVTKDIKQEYVELIKESLNLGSKKIKFAIDCGNGTASVIIKDIISSLGLDCEFLYCESDPTFPNHQPDPADVKNQQDLANLIKEKHLDYGFSVDGDADRVGIIDEKGDVIASDLFLLIIYKDLANKLTEKKAIYDVKCSKTLIDELDRLGYNKTMYRTGNSYMNKKINEENYMFGGEFSGHVWFRDKFPGFDDGIYAGLRILEILTNTDKNLSELLLGLNKYFSTEEIKIKVTEEAKFKIVDNIKKYCDEQNYKYNDIDGVRVEFDDSWALVRASNTGPNLIVRFEAITNERLEQIQSEFINKINELI